MLTIDHPDRVLSLTAMSTSAGAGDEDLPGMSPALAEAFAALPEPDWTDDEAVVAYMVRASACLRQNRSTRRRSARSPRLPWPAPRTTSRARRTTTRRRVPVRRHRLGEITVPTLVIHGADDPLFPLPHGEALAREIPGARLVVLPHTGHEFPRRNWPLVIPEILAVTDQPLH